MNNVTERYKSMMKEDFRDEGEIIVEWTYKDDNNNDVTLTLCNSEPSSNVKNLSSNNALTYETYVNPLTVELPYTTLKFTFIDEDREFDPHDSTSKSRFIKSRQKVKMYYRQYYSYTNGEIDYTDYDDVNIDTLWTTGEYTYKDRELTISAQDRLSFISNETFNYTQTLKEVKEGYDYIQTLKQMFLQLGIDFCIENEQTEIGHVVISKEETCLDGIQNICNSLGYTFRFSNDNCIVENLTDTENQETLDYEITFEDMFEIPEIDTTNNIRSMTVSYYPCELLSGEDALDVEWTTESVYTPILFQNYYYNAFDLKRLSANVTSETPCVFADIRNNGNFISDMRWTVCTKDLYNFYVSVEYRYNLTTENEEAESNIQLYVHNFDNTKNTLVYPETIGDYGEDKTLDNKYVTTEEQALKLAKYYYNSNLPQNKMTLNFRGEPSLELNDVIKIETEFESLVDYRINKITYTYDGALTGTLDVTRRYSE